MSRVFRGLLARLFSSNPDFVPSWSDRDAWVVIEQLELHFPAWTFMLQWSPDIKCRAIIASRFVPLLNHEIARHFGANCSVEAIIRELEAVELTTR